MKVSENVRLKKVAVVMIYKPGRCSKDGEVTIPQR